MEKERHITSEFIRARSSKLLKLGTGSWKLEAFPVPICPREYRGPLWGNMIIMRLLVFASGLTLVAACSGRVEDNPVTTARLMTGNAIPPIDRDLPEKFETATFAVG